MFAAADSCWDVTVGRRDTPEGSDVLGKLEVALAGQAGRPEGVSLDGWPGAAVVGDGCMNGAFRHQATAAVPGLAAFVFGDADTIRQRDLSVLAGTLRLCEESGDGDATSFKRAWRTYWRLVNQIQFAERFELVTSLGLRDGCYGHLLEETLDLGRRVAPVNELLAALLELAAPEVRPLLEAIAARGLRLPDVGFELTGADGEIVAEAELVWPDLRVAVVTTNQSALRGLFNEAGWRTWTVEELGLSPAPLFVALGGIR